MKRLFVVFACCSCVILSHCITDFIAKGINEEKDILVVEGTITDGESIITLRRSINLNDEKPSSTVTVDNALVYVECEDGTKILSKVDSPLKGNPKGLYTIPTGKLNPEKKYGLIIEVDGDVFRSDNTYPINTPEIDSVFWTKKEKGQPVNLHVATHDPENRVLYYRWSYLEEWEIIVDIDSSEANFKDRVLGTPQFYYPYRCWNFRRNNELLIGSSEKTVFGKVTDILTSFSASDRRLEILYRITVKQNVISKRAYDYFENIKKNTQKIEGLFAPTPSELRGNIKCITNPAKPVIGYVEISSTTEKRIYIKPIDRVYEYPGRPWLFPCFEPLPEGEIKDILMLEPEAPLPDYFVPYFWGKYNDRTQPFFVDTHCIDCTNYGTVDRPADWP